MKKTVIALICLLSAQQFLMAQSYLHTRVGAGWGRYAPYDKEALDHDEHYVNYALLADVEYGAELHIRGMYDNLSLLLGVRAGYNLRDIQGIYTKNRWEPDANITANMYSGFVTLGTSLQLSKNFSMFLQANIGPTYITWYQEGQYKDHFWVFYLPMDLGGTYKLQDDLFLTFGLNIQMPIYTGTQETFVIGIKKAF